MKNKTYLIFILTLAFNWTLAADFSGGISVQILYCDNPIGASIDLTVDGGFNPFDFQWSNGETTEDITDLQQGEYCITVTDALCGMATLCVMVLEVNCCNDCYGISATVNYGGIHVDVECESSNNFTYQWSDGGIGNNRTDLNIGTHCVTVTSGNGCQLFGCWEVTEGCPAIQTLTGGDANITASCTAANRSGAIEITALPVSGFLYSWTGPNAYSSYTRDIYNLEAGEYCLTVHTIFESSCVYAQACFTVSPDGENCCNDCQSLQATIGYGSIIVELECEFSQGFSYQWSDGSTDHNRTGLEAGTYCLTLTSSAGCYLSDCWEIIEGCPLPQELTSQNVLINDCSTANNSSIEITSFPASGYQYSWTGPNGYTANTRDIYNLAAGEYCVDIHPLLGSFCLTASGCFEVSDNGLSVYTASIKNNISCGENCSGSINLEATPAQGLVYQWAGPNGFAANTQDISGLCNGEYTVTVSNTNGCSIIKKITICCCRESFHPPGDDTPPDPHPHLCYDPPYDPDNPYPDAPPISIQVINRTPIDEVNTTGAIDIKTSGGVRDLYFLWNGPNGFLAYTEDISNLEVGQYCVTVTDGCTSEEKCIKIVDCRQVEWNVQASLRPSCPGADAGSIEITTILGGEGPFIYTWSNGSSQTMLTSLATGNYSLTLESTNGCSYSKSFVISEVAPVINVSSVSIGHTCPDYAYGSISFNVSGDDPPFSYSWSNGKSSRDIGELGTGIYRVTIYDNRGCPTVREYTINDSNTIIREDQTNRDDCLIEYYCNELSILELAENIGYNDHYDPNDCRFYFHQCNDGGFYDPPGEKGPIENRGYRIDYDFENCTAQRVCYSEEPYGSPVNGTIETKNYHGPTSSGSDQCIHCFTAIRCVIKVGDEDQIVKVLSVESHLAALPIPNSSGCEAGNTASCLIDFSCSFLPAGDDVFLDDYCDDDCDATNNLCTEAEMIEIAENFRKEMEQHIEEAYTIEDEGKNIVAKIYPNPFQSYFYIEIYSTFDKNIDLMITSMDGRTVKKHTSHLLEGSNVIRIDDLAEHSSGVYIISIFDRQSQNLLSFPMTKF